jgi:magnesium-transporting ATPase (P-type)
VTVAAIAQAVGIDPGPGAVEGDELPDDDRALGELAASRRVFARLKPEQKRRLIDVLRARGGYVAMIGDGVNDVPAMKAARLSIALGSGSQLAKSVADSVLVADRFGAIPDAVGEGRRIIRNVQRVANLFVTKSVFAAAVIVTFGLTTAEFPLLPRHLSLAATFTVGIPGFVLALAPGKAAKPSGSFLRRVARFSIPAGVVEAAAVVLAYLAVAELRGYSQQEGRTAATTVFVAVGLYLLLVLEADRMSGSRRYSVGVLTLVTLLAVGYLLVLGSPGLREFFALSTPGVWMAIVCVAVTVLSIRLLSWVGLSPYRPLPADTYFRPRAADDGG